MSAARPDDNPIPTEPGMYSITRGKFCVLGVLSHDVVTGDVRWLVTGWSADASLARMHAAFSICTFTRLEPVKESEGLDSEPHVDDRRMVAELREFGAGYGTDDVATLLIESADRVETLGRHDVILRHQRNKFDDQLRAMRSAACERMVVDIERQRWLPEPLEESGDFFLLWVGTGKYSMIHFDPVKGAAYVNADNEPEDDRFWPDSRQVLYRRRYPVSLPDLDGDK